MQRDQILHTFSASLAAGLEEMASMAVGSDGWIADGKPTAVEEGRQAV